MIVKVISGGQTGADQAGWRAAKGAGIATGGWMPRGFKAEDGWHPEFADLYGARAHASATYRDRTIANIGDADLTFCFCHDVKSAGSRLTRDVSEQLGKPFLFIIRGVSPGPEWLSRSSRPDLRSTLNVAGNRESRAPGIGEWVEWYLAEVFLIVNQET